MIALLRKEIQEHGLVLSLLVLIAAVVSWFAIDAAHHDGEPTLLRFRYFVIVVLGSAAYYVPHRLVGREYGSRTQLFLEGLPVSRALVVTAKLGLGSAFVFALLVATLATFVAADATALPAPALVTNVLIRAALFVFTLFSACFMVGFLGRYRIPLVVMSFALLITIENQTELELSRFGPFRLVDATFASEAGALPLDAVAWAAGLIVLFLATAYGLALTREGNLAAALAERMSQKEKVFVVLLIVSTVFVAYVVDERRQKVPFDLADAVVARGGPAFVKVVRHPAFGDPQALADDIHGALSRLSRELELDRLPRVFVAGRVDLDPDRFERGQLEKSEGVVVRIKPDALPGQRARFVAWLVREVLSERSHGRVGHEPARWILDGFAERFGGAGRSGALRLRALYGTEGRVVDRALLDRWLTFEEAVGVDVAAGVAWFGLETIERHKGEAQLFSFLQSALATDVPRDLRALFVGPTLEDHLRTIGWSEAELFAAWNADLVAARRAHAADLERIPRLSADMRVEPLSDLTRRLSFALRPAAPEPDAPRARLRYASIQPHTTLVLERLVRVEDHGWARAHEGVSLGGTWARGARVRWTFEVEVPALEGHVISGWRREAIP